MKGYRHAKGQVTHAPGAGDEGVEHRRQILTKSQSHQLKIHSLPFQIHYLIDCLPMGMSMYTDVRLCEIDSYFLAVWPKIG